MNKRAIQLTINFIVMFILAMSMFAAGLMIARKIFSTADDVKKSLSEQQKDKLRAILLQGKEKVKVETTRLNLAAGDYDLFGLAIRNDFDTDRDFYINSYCDAVILFGGTILCDEDVGSSCDAYDKWLTIEEENYGGPYTIKPNDVYIHEVFIVVPKGEIKGTYVYNIEVCEGLCDGINGYGTVKKLNVIIE